MPHLLRCQGLAVKYYGLTSAELSRCPPLDAFRSETKIPLAGGYGASSAFATTGLIWLTAMCSHVSGK